MCITFVIVHARLAFLRATVVALLLDIEHENTGSNLGFLALQGRHNVPINVKSDKHGRAYHRLTLACQIFPLLKKTLMAFVRRIPTAPTFRQLLSSWRTVHAIG